jgi:hypothetical protein
MLLAGCSPPDRKVIEFCQQNANARARGRALISSDVGELVEECMAGKGYRLRETSHICSSNYATTINANCYYRDTVLGRLIAATE